MRDRHRRCPVEEFGRRGPQIRRHFGRAREDFGGSDGAPGNGQLGILGLGFWRDGNRNVEEIGDDLRVEEC